MNYNKQPIPIDEQVKKLKSRGLNIPDEAKAASYLSNISYYRLRAYTYPFQDNTQQDHPFEDNIHFDEIIKLYVFDRQFRLLVLDAIEKIEISMRTQIIYQWAMNHGSHWHLESALFRDSVQFARNFNKLQQEVDRSVETFIDHYRTKYTHPPEPPSWMSLEVSSFGLLSLLFRNLKNGKEKKAVTKYYGLNDVGVLESWMHSFSNIRNICAHHGRLWNRRLTAVIKLPTNTKNPFISNQNLLPYKIYPALCCMKYILDIISPGHSYTEKLFKMMGECSLVQEKEMGFPAYWKDDKFWKI
jgi:abortive infection bacteriophage resistance protein